MKFAYYDLSEDLFEALTVAICTELLGLGVQSFSKGRDGGRDARFVGTAKQWPNESYPASGNFIIQAKHTMEISAKFTDSHFSGEGKSSTISEEIEKLKKLVNTETIDHYLLFANRRLPGTAMDSVLKRLKDETGILSIHLFGNDDLDRYLKYFPRISLIVDISPLDSPLRVSPDELAEIILKLSDDLPKIELPPPQERFEFEEKNKINGLSSEYAKEIKRYLREFEAPIRQFLGSPDNEEFTEKYYSVTEEFRLKIISHRQYYHSFDKVLDVLFDILISRDFDLKKNKRLTRAMLFYMYWNCDIGSEVND